MNIITKIECGKRNKDRVNIYIDEGICFFGGYGNCLQRRSKS